MGVRDLTSSERVNGPLLQLPGLGLKLVLVAGGMEDTDSTTPSRPRPLPPAAPEIWEAMESKKAQFHLQKHQRKGPGLRGRPLINHLGKLLDSGGLSFPAVSQGL